MQRFLRLEFLPLNVDLGLLLLRLWLGGLMLGLHGWGKLQKVMAGNWAFADPMGIGEKPSLIMAVSAEVICSALLILGLFGRLATIPLIATMLVAFFVVHGGALSGPNSGEMAFLYLGGYLTILFAGTGRYSVDRNF